MTNLLMYFLLWFNSFFGPVNSELVMCRSDQGHPTKTYQQHIQTWYGLVFYESMSQEKWIQLQDRRFNSESPYLCEVQWRRALNPAIIEFYKAEGEYSNKHE